MSSHDTIFALSSGPPPAAIAVIRISGPNARFGLETLIRRLPPPRRASLAKLFDPTTGAVLDEGLALWFPGPRSETGEDMVELHLHGGRAGRIHPARLGKRPHGSHRGRRPRRPDLC